MPDPGVLVFWRLVSQKMDIRIKYMQVYVFMCLFQACPAFCLASICLTCSSVNRI